MATWDVVATVKAPAKQVLAFVAHHLMLGAQRVWLYFDDPLSEVPELLSRHPQVNVTLCDDAYWAKRGKRHERHQNRQARNARDAYGRTHSQWLTHIDVDEFIQADRPVDHILARISPEGWVVQLEPFEAMHDPDLPDDIFTARHFRGPLRAEHADLRQTALGEYAEVIPEGMLSHSVGKAFFRTGIPRLSPRLHGAMLDGQRVPSLSRNAEMRVLHFHAQDRLAWQSALPFRLTRGAYQYRPALQSFLLDADPLEIDRFYLRTQTLADDTTRILAAQGRLVNARLGLRQKVIEVLEET